MLKRSWKLLPDSLTVQVWNSSTRERTAKVDLRGLCTCRVMHYAVPTTKGLPHPSKRKLLVFIPMSSSEKMTVPLPASCAAPATAIRGTYTSHNSHRMSSPCTMQALQPPCVLRNIVASHQVFLPRVAVAGVWC